MAKSRFTYIRMLLRFRNVLRNDHLVLSALGIIVGCATGASIIVFREFIQFTQFGLFGAAPENLLGAARELPWWQILAIPTGMGLLVGLVVHHFLPDRRPQGVADVIEANALQGGRMSSRVGLKVAIARQCRATDPTGRQRHHEEHQRGDPQQRGHKQQQSMDDVRQQVG